MCKRMCPLAQLSTPTFPPARCRPLEFASQGPHLTSSAWSVGHICRVSSGSLAYMYSYIYSDFSPGLSDTHAMSSPRHPHASALHTGTF